MYIYWEWSVTNWPIIEVSKYSSKNPRETNDSIVPSKDPPGRWRWNCLPYACTLWHQLWLGVTPGHVCYSYLVTSQLLLEEYILSLHSCSDCRAGSWSSTILYIESLSGWLDLSRMPQSERGWDTVTGLLSWEVFPLCASGGLPTLCVIEHLLL